MIVSAHQPLFIPWLGFFHKMSMCDKFVILDHVEYTVTGFGNRNNVKGSQGNILITVPIKKCKKTQQVNEVLMDYHVNWRKKMLKTIKFSYQRADHFEEFYENFSTILLSDCECLCDLNFKLIEMIACALHIKCDIIRSSDLSLCGQKQDMLVSLVKSIGGNDFVAGMGASARYIDKDYFAEKGLGVAYQDFSSPTYEQLYGDYIPNLSALDFLMNCGSTNISQLIKTDA